MGFRVPDNIENILWYFHVELSIYNHSIIFITRGNVSWDRKGDELAQKVQTFQQCKTKAYGLLEERSKMANGRRLVKQTVKKA